MRLIAQQQEHLDHLRERTEKRLAAVQGVLESLHRWNRGSRVGLQRKSPATDLRLIESMRSGNSCASESSDECGSSHLLASARNSHPRATGDAAAATGGRAPGLEL